MTPQPLTPDQLRELRGLAERILEVTLAPTWASALARPYTVAGFCEDARGY